MVHSGSWEQFIRAVAEWMGEMGRARLEREGGFRMWGGGTLLLSARESYDLLFLEMGLEVLEMNGYLVSFPPGVGSGVRGDTQQCVGVGRRKVLKFLPLCQVWN